MFFQGNEKYNCATYLRLSRSDGDQQESNSIKNQRALLNDYMGKHPELHKFDEYVDDGYSGTNFERPDFKRMMQDIEKRNVNCIIVKDLSRFGRNYIETGRYLERIFPFMGVRFIAINDHYDSAEENDDKGRILIPFNYNIVADLGEIQNLTVQAAGIGNNLNQIARYFHSGGLASRGMLEELKRCIAEIRELRQEIVQLRYSTCQIRVIPALNQANFCAISLTS